MSPEQELLHINRDGWNLSSNSALHMALKNRMKLSLFMSLVAFPAFTIVDMFIRNREREKWSKDGEEIR